MTNGKKMRDFAFGEAYPNHVEIEVEEEKLPNDPEIPKTGAMAIESILNVAKGRIPKSSDRKRLAK